MTHVQARAVPRIAVLAALLFSAACDRKRPVEPVTDTTYHIEIRFYGPEPSPDVRAAFEAARLRIEKFVTADLVNTRINNIDLNDSKTCGVPATVNETIDDLVIYATAKPIDGPGKIQASSGPCLVRSTNKLPVIGKMEMDSDDLAQLAGTGRLNAVVLHEMLHVLGFGTIWDQVVPARISGAGGADPRFSGPLAIQACSDAGGSATCSAGVPVEDCVAIPQCGEGTRDSHWKESTFRAELMTGYIEGTGVPMPLSAITIQSFADLGYTVNPAAADPYRLPGTAVLMADDTSAPQWELTRRAAFKVSPDGTLTR